MYYKRVIDLEGTLRRKSTFLLGPRQTGKSSMLRKRYPDALILDLLRPAVFMRYQSDPSQFGREVEYAYVNENVRLVVVDEVQKLPDLLDEVHRLIEQHKDLRFVLTGSSARKLKRSGVNLLGGRASRFHLHPLVFPEFDTQEYMAGLDRNLTYGFLPSILLSEYPWQDLTDYVGLYLREEIQQEAIARSLDGFSRFLNSVATTNAEQVNYTNVGNDAQVPPRTVREYYQVLEDTLIGKLVPAFTKTSKRKAMTSAKFYLFDPGITNALLGRKSISRKTTEYGGLLEQLVFGELSAFFDYQGSPNNISYWRSTSKFEVDFLVNIGQDKHIGIEVKSTARPRRTDYKGLFALEEDIKLERKLVVCLAEQAYVDEGVAILPLQQFLTELWKGALM